MTIFNSLEFFAYLALTSKDYENLFKKTSKGKYGHEMKDLINDFVNIV